MPETVRPAHRSLWRAFTTRPRRALMSVIDPELAPWSDLSDHTWPTLLLGNGSSINVWPKFSYTSLHHEAKLNTEAEALFSGLKTTNFETVLEAMGHAEMVLEAMGFDASDVQNLYSHVQNRLFTAVRSVHVPWQSMDPAVLSQIESAMHKFDKVFTTNYDLIPYWSIMSAKSPRFVDFLWQPGSRFDIKDTKVIGGREPIYYLHGGLHLWQSALTGETGKWINNGADLLQLGRLFTRRRDRRPLFVSEGTSDAKQRAIRGSDYLTFATESLADDVENTVVFGHSLGSADNHIVDALRVGNKKRIAVGLLPAPDRQILKRKAKLLADLDPHRVQFFDASTHPLGAPGLRVA
jgi:hypothetical protein